MLKTEVCFVRHGQTDWNLQGYIQGRENNPLNQVGLQQARETAQFLKQQKWDMIISSPLIRAYDTAKEIAKEAGIASIILDNSFLERNFGEISGQKVAVYLDSDLSQTWEGFETDEEIKARVWKGMEEVIRKYEGKRLIVVAHSHAIKAFLTQIAPEKLQMRSKFNNACSSFASYEKGQWTLERYNVSDHITVQ